MISNILPSVLLDSRGSISMERALKQIRDLLKQFPSDMPSNIEDRIQASLDDVETMLAHIDRS